MSLELRAFLIKPNNIIVYSLSDEDSEGAKNLIYNAGSLELVEKPFESFQEVEGTITNRFGVTPVVLHFTEPQDRLKVVYTFPSDNRLFTSESQPLESDFGIIESVAPLLIPDLTRIKVTAKKEVLPSIQLTDFNREAILNWSKPLKSLTLTPPEDLEDLEEAKDLEGLSPMTMMDFTKAKDLEDLKIQDLTEVKDLEKKVQHLTDRISDLEGILEVMNRRIYQIYPVTCPSQLRIENEMIPVVEFEEVMKKFNEKEIETYTMEPKLQAYAGSHRGNNRMFIFLDKKGNKYLARCNYDPKNNEINAPK